MAWSLVSKEQVVSITPVPESALEDFWSDTVEGLIRQHLGMPNLGRQATITEELHNGDGTNILLVKKPPIVSVTSLVVNDLTLLESEYVVTPYSVQLRYTTFPKGVLTVALTYVSGSADVAEIDPVVQLTAAAMIAAIWNYRSRAGSDASIKWGGVETTEGEEGPNEKVGLTSHLKRIMKNMLRRERLRVR